MDQPAVHATGGVKQKLGHARGDEMPKPDEKDDRTQERDEMDGTTRVLERGAVRPTEVHEMEDATQDRLMSDTKLELDLSHEMGGARLTADYRKDDVKPEQRDHEMDDVNLQPGHYETDGVSQNLDEMDACQTHREHDHHLA
jgi:hypothetical protein